MAQKAEAERPGEETPRVEPKQDGAVRRMARSVWQLFISQSFSSLTRRIVFLNLTGLSRWSPAYFTCRSSARD